MNLFVSNLNPETRAEALKTLFADFGEVVSAKVIFDSATGASRGFGFVEMAERNQSHDAIDNLDMSYFEGNIINVKEAKQNNAGGGGRPGNSRPGGYGNNRQGGYNTNRPGGGGYNNNRPSSYNRPQAPRYSNNNGYNSGNSSSGGSNISNNNDNFNRL